MSINDNRTTNEEDRTKSKKDKPLYRDPVKLVPLIGALIAAILGGLALHNHFFPPSTTSFEFILDTSRGMKGKLGNQNKLRSVKRHILAQVLAIPNVPAALRLAGGNDCRREYQPPLVEFGEDNYDEFETELSEVKAHGKSNLATALQHAANDLAQRSKQVSNEATTIFVIVGSPDTCTGSAAEDAIHTALRAIRAEENVEINLKFVGIKPSKALRQLLKNVHRDAIRLGYTAPVKIVKNPDDLDTIPCGTPVEEEYDDCP